MSDSTRAEVAVPSGTVKQQRVAVARILLRRPDVVFLDEASSAMDPAAEARCYRAIVAAVPLVVSVGHRPSLEAFHTHSLECEHESEPWRFRPLDVSQKRG